MVCKLCVIVYSGFIYFEIVIDEQFYFAEGFCIVDNFTYFL
jgi:hypothetical protein